MQQSSEPEVQSGTEPTDRLQNRVGMNRAASYHFQQRMSEKGSLMNVSIGFIPIDRKKEISTCDLDMLVPVTRRVTAVMAYSAVHVVSRRATAVTRRVGSCSVAPARCPKDVKISAPLRDHLRSVQSPTA
jgi:hypothetical protein